MLKFRNLFFDLDGTLTDPKIGITRSIQFALRRLGREILHADELEWCIGPPLLESLTELVGKSDATRALEWYREHFATRGLFENRVYAGIPDLLSLLQDRGHVLYLATSKPQVFAEQILEHFELAEYFTHLFGSELDGTRVDKTELLKFALKQTGALASHSLMIGDRYHDIVGARANELIGVGVLYGYGTKMELENAGADFMIEHPLELMTVLSEVR